MAPRTAEERSTPPDPAINGHSPDESETDGEPDGDSTELPDDGTDLEANDLIEILSNQRRRYLWRYLRDEGGEVSLSEASRQVAAWENETTLEEVSYDQRKSVYTSLHQFHCPKMDEAGLIDFDKRESTVRLSSTLPSELVVEIEPDTENVRETILGALAIASGIILGSWALGLPVFGNLTLAAVLLSLGIGAAAAVFVYSLLARAEYGVSLADALSRVDS